MQGRGFWLSQDSVHEVGIGSSHAKEIIRFPEKYGFSGEYIRELYRSHKEPLYLEGRAREQLIREAAGKGFIRIRENLRPLWYWSIQFDFWQQRKEVISCWIRQALTDGLLSPESTVVLTGFRDGFLLPCSAGELSEG